MGREQHRLVVPGDDVLAQVRCHGVPGRQLRAAPVGGLAVVGAGLTPGASGSPGCTVIVWVVVRVGGEV